MSKRGMRRTLVGVVVSNKMDKTAVVAVEETVTHEDHVLATLTEDVAVVRIETVPANQTIEDRVFVFGAGESSHHLYALLPKRRDVERAHT